MKKIYKKPLARIVWYGLDEGVMDDNIGGMERNSGPSNDPEENYVRENIWDEGFDSSESGNSGSGNGGVWDKAW